jgi:tRNA dimethylallyltransferase
LRNLRIERGPEYLHKILKRIDRKSAERLSRRDFVRVQRGIEVFFQTGKRLSDLQPNRAERPEFAERIRIFMLDPPRPILYQKINERTQMHFDRGLVEEVRQLRDSGVSDETNALGAHGYRRACEFLQGRRSLAEAIEQTKQDVRNYAKRQVTWFRKEPGVVWLGGFGSDPEVRKKLFEEIG